MKRLSTYVLSAALILSACDKRSDFSRSGTMEEVAKQGLEIEELKAQIRQLKTDQEFHEKQDQEWRAAAVRDFDNISNQVAKNAKVQNDNEKIDDDRWNAIRQRLNL